MPELTLEIGGRLFEVACEVGQEKALEDAGKLLDEQAQQIASSPAAATEKRMLLLSGLMLADSMSGLKAEIALAEEALRSAEERVRIAEAKSAMLQANALKGGASAAVPNDIAALQSENEAAAELLAKVLDDINDIAEKLENGAA